MDVRDTALELLETHGYTHIIYGYRANGVDHMTHDSEKFLRSRDDDTYVAQVDMLQAKTPGLEMVYAVHKN